jgi:hypothetical protein
LLEVGCERAIGVQDGLGKHGADIKIVKLAVEVLAGCLDGGFHLVVDAVLLEPHAELGLWQRLGKTLRAEDDAEHGQTDAFPTA